MRLAWPSEPIFDIGDRGRRLAPPACHHRYGRMIGDHVAEVAWSTLTVAQGRAVELALQAQGVAGQKA